MFFFFNQKTADEMRISDWSSDVCSSDLGDGADDEEEVLGELEGEGSCQFAELVGEVPEFTRVHLLQLTEAHPAEPGEQRAHRPFQLRGEIGRASCRERVCPYV